jgi:hypothetical protein
MQVSSHSYRPTTACSDLGRHKVHEPDCYSRFEVSDSALGVGRPVADPGRSAALPIQEA